MSSPMPEFSHEDLTYFSPPISEVSGEVFDKPTGEIINLSESNRVETTPEGRFSRLRSYLSKSVLNNSIRTFLVVDTLIDDYNQAVVNSDSLKEKATLRYTAGMTITGQAYERLRLPEVFGIAATTRVYKEALENGWNSALATAGAATTLGLFVYGQQKIIGRNFVNTAKYFPQTYDTVNQQWPKTINAIGDAIPSEKNRVSEGWGMFGLGTTPFIASSRATNPEISIDELKNIERRVTRRGAWFSAAVGASALGVKSLSVHLPTSVAEEAVKKSDQVLDVVSNPYIVAGGFMVWGVAKTAGRHIKKRGNLN